jgi:hypothetical protein
MSEPNTVNVNDDLIRAVGASLNPEDIRAAVLAEAEKQSAASTVAAADQAATDQAAADTLAREQADAASVGFSRTEKIGGRDFLFEAGSEIELERMINNAYKVAYAVTGTEETAPYVDPAVAAAAAQKAAEEEAVARVELETKFKRGDISTAEYLEQSGAVKDYLQKQGVPLESLRDAVNQNQATAETQSWADATQVFLNSSAGSDWPGGENNLEIIGLKLQALHLENATDKVAALAQAYASMKSTGTLFPYQAPVSTEPVAAATPAEIIAAAAERVIAAPVYVAPAPRVASTSSSLFGASSGTSGAPSTAPVAAAKSDIPADASPAEIIAAWKQGQIAAGKDPNAAFTETFSGRRV